MRTPGPSGGRKRSIRPGAGAKSRAGSSAFSLISIACPRRGTRPPTSSRSPAAMRSCSPHDVDPGHELADGVLDLQARVQLDEVEVAVGAEQELERARILVADRAAGTLDGRLHRRPRRLVERRRRRLLDQLLVPALDRALALAERRHAAVGVAEHLDLDVACRRDRLLEVELAVRERGLGLDARGRVGGLELRPARTRAACPCRRRPRRPSAAPGSRARSAAARTSASDARALGARHERHAGRTHLRLGAGLVAHPLHHVCARADEDEVVLLAGADEARGSRRGSRSPGAPPRSRSSRPPRSRPGCAGSSARRRPARCRRPGRPDGRGATRGPRSSRRRPPRRRARAAPG